MNREPTVRLEMTSPSGDELKAARLKTGLSQVDAAALMGYPVQTGSRGGLQSRTWQALESTTDLRNMPGPIFAMFQLLTGTHTEYVLIKRDSTAEMQEADTPLA
ncbi:MAG: helix-turn-helix transcriptional regulator [Burkholderiales bacterium]|jgi:hypothetical protein|nr:helix-turn-helix transcriptional regulator [Burkholderiales bacterium]